MSGEMGYRFCARCGRQLMRDQDGPSCLSCGWRPPAAGDARSALETMSTEELTGHWRQRMASLDRRIAVHEQEIADIKAERAKFERLLVAVEGKPSRPAGSKVNTAGDGQRWTCPGCGWQAAGRFPGRHTFGCAEYKAKRADQPPAVLYARIEEVTA